MSGKRGVSPSADKAETIVWVLMTEAAACALSGMAHSKHMHKAAKWRARASIGGRLCRMTAPGPDDDNGAIRATLPALGAPLLKPRHSFEPADNQRLASLCGPLDEHLRQIEAALGVTITRRDATFEVGGARAAAERALALLVSLYERARHPIDARSLQLAVAQVQAAAAEGAGAGRGIEPAADVPVLRTRRTELSGRTPNQVQYLKQMLASDITFGIGPAGTGKTFLAVACAVDALERQRRAAHRAHAPGGGGGRAARLSAR